MISFVILHYKNINDTLECMKSIKKIKTNKEISIIVVDNNTLNNDEVEKIQEYTKDIILLKENMGFAKGNNEGCKYAIKKYNPDFLCVINSDTVIEQLTFIDTIYDLYTKYDFDIMGPKILPEDLDSSNPFPVYKTIDEVENRIKYTEKLIKVYKSKILRNLLNIYIKIKALFIKPIKLKNGEEEQTGIAVHGCAIIFSKKYYEKFNEVFYPNTFLYHEEEFLYLRSRQNNLITLYSPKLEIIHKEGQSLSKKFNNKKYDALIFRNQEILKSLKLLKQEMLNSSKDVK